MTRREKLLLLLGITGAVLASLSLLYSPWPWTVPLPISALCVYLFVTAEVRDVSTPRD